MKHAAILIEDGRKDNLFAFRVAERIRDRGGKVSFLFTRRSAEKSLASHAVGFDQFPSPGLANELAVRWGFHRFLIGSSVRELKRRNVDVILAILDFGLNSFLLSETKIPAGIISRCIIPKKGAWEVDPDKIRQSLGRRINSSIRRFFLRHEEQYKAQTRRTNTYFAWGQYDRERLLEQGVPDEHILISGCPLYEGMLTHGDIERIQSKRGKLTLSETAVVYSQPLEKPFMLGHEAGLKEKLAFFQGLVRAGFVKLIVHLHPEESEYSTDFVREVGAPMICHRNMDLARRLDLLQEHGWYFTFASTSIFEGIYAGAQSYLYQLENLGSVSQKLPGFVVLNARTLSQVRHEPYQVDAAKLMNYWIADADHSVTFLENWIAERLGC